MDHVGLWARVILSLVLVGGVLSCASLGAGPELRITHPTIIAARFLDQDGKPMTTLDFKDGEAPPPGAKLQVIATGFAPIKAVWIENLDGSRAIQVPSRSDKIYELSLDLLIGPQVLPEGAQRQLSYLIVAINIDDHTTTSRRLPLFVRRAVAH